MTQYEEIRKENRREGKKILDIYISINGRKNMTIIKVINISRSGNEHVC